jgi:hypothetical protein
MSPLDNPLCHGIISSPEKIAVLTAEPLKCIFCGATENVSELTYECDECFQNAYSYELPRFSRLAQ